MHTQIGSSLVFQTYVSYGTQTKMLVYSWLETVHLFVLEC